MLKHRLTDRICCIVLASTLALTVLFMSAAACGVVQAESGMGYETRLFDQSRVHTIDIVMNDWTGFLETCVNEEYSPCTVVIDGEKYSNIGIRGKGNTSLSSVAAYGNNRYSFKLEFDQYTSGKTYYGLDKLSLNNIIQDYTYLKDYMAYTLMNEMGVASSLCSFVYITVNGEDWGLYLAVEAVEDGFLERNYGKDYGELYKPDSMSFGGGRGNGMDFDMSEFKEQFNSENSTASASKSAPSNTNSANDTGGETAAAMPIPGDMPEGFDPSTMFGEDFDPSSFTGGKKGFDPSNFGGGGGGFGGGMGSSDVRLQYIDDDPDSYSNIFNNAKTDVTDADKARLIQSLKTLSEGENVESVVDVEAVIRYLVVHNFMCNDDSYTGMMVHNYYLYEEDGVLSMIPWDYNLAIGGFSMGGGFGGASGASSGATSTVNSPIDSPVSGGDLSTRPMIAWIFGSEEYTALYHEVYAEFIAKFYDGGWFQNTLSDTINMIAPYVEKDPTAFCTYEQFKTATAALKEFCLLRCESISGQLDGTIPSTSAGQNEDSSALIDASQIELSDMGEFGGGGGGGGRNGGGGGGMPNMGDFSGGQPPDADATQTPANSAEPSGDGDKTQSSQNPDRQARPEGDFPTAPQGASMPGDSGGMSAEAWILLATCVVALVGGIIVARRFKDNN